MEASSLRSVLTFAAFGNPVLEIKNESISNRISLDIIIEKYMKRLKGDSKSLFIYFSAVTSLDLRYFYDSPSSFFNVYREFLRKN